MSDFRFADPSLVHALWGVALFVGLLFWLDQRGGSALERLVGAPLQSRLVSRPGSWRRTLRIILLGLAAASAVLALMRPQWGMREIASSRTGAQVMIALDVSRSMLAEDVAPNRLERAKAEIVDLLSYMKGDQVGLIAFAGRAAVLAPLTPDFGFLRLVLDNTGPGSVARGGTRLAEPIKKAVDGFGPSKGASRAILLITDGEDHDSFPQDTVKAAAEAGIKIIAIGFGDEAGSEIRVTDPRTGARQAIRDANGRPVMSRLDGDLLRELALATNGAYIPAGTGVLDLESIYDGHIARLTRGELEGRRTVRDEGYPWFVLLALVLLVSSAAVSGGRLFGAGPTVRAALVVLLALGVAHAPPVAAQPTPADPLERAPGDALADPLGGLPADPDTAAAGSAGGAEAPAVSQETPREIYNRGVAAIEGRELEAAERALTSARREAKGDDVLRYHAAFNLGWAAVQQSGRVRGDAPQDALDHLHRAADWFREAVRLTPDDEDARYNLEVALRLAVILADEIAKKSDGGVDGALKELARRQREEVARAAALLERAAAEAADPAIAGDSQALRDAFRAGATSQRAVLADADQLAARAAGELEGIEGRPEEERTPEDAMRAAQLGGVMGYLHRARERMGQARRQLRDRRGERAYRRTSAALHELKRALDQLRDPVAILDQLLREGSETARATALLELSGRSIPGLAEQLPELPAWLSVGGLAEDQRAQSLRIAELEARLVAGLERADAEGAPAAPEQVEMLEAVREAFPLVEAAREQSSGAADALESERLADARAPQREALASLADARERFLDLRGLIEAAHTEQARISEVLGPETTDGEDRASIDRLEYLPSLRAAQARNLARGDRLDAKLQAEVSKLSQQALAAENAQSQDPAEPPPDPEILAQRQQQLDIAGQLLTLALGGMDGVARGLEGPGDGVDWERVGSDSAQAVSHLESLRRLFFSIVEHVREVARQQVDLADRTQDALALAAGPDADPERLVGALLPGEQALAEQTLAIANALEQQSSEAAATAAEDPEAEEGAQRLRQAAEHVLLAQTEMEGASAALTAPVDFEAARGAQDLALEELRQALEILEPPQEGDPGEDGQQQDQQQQQEQQQEQQQGEQDEQEQQQDREAQRDPGQLLQDVRDREAQRRREQAARNSGYETVEKDW